MQKYTEILHGVRFEKSKINASKDEENLTDCFSANGK
jgi:hypothetical protein